MLTRKNSEDKNAENSENKCEAIDTSNILINENGATNDEPNVAVEIFSLSDKLHGLQSLPNYGESSHSTLKECESKKTAKYKEKRQLKNNKYWKKKKKLS
ncbi:hypothetical protein AVEN_9898-1 [Araneus ventricosus]|uniref:Uncharacterized protein n=1 Tax=Araneus ventricosus TaxID=182803 RepID=A0A4Y2UPE7_ARAVE|nr:hypothetical protein AVEN_9898-1 [Araneus ventricosus]